MTDTGRTDRQTDRQTPHDGMDRACASRGKVAESSQLVVTTELKDIEPQPHEVQTATRSANRGVRRWRSSVCMFVCLFVCQLKRIYNNEVF